MSNIGLDFGTTYTCGCFRHDSGYQTMKSREADSGAPKPTMAVQLDGGMRYATEAESAFLDMYYDPKRDKVFTGFKMMLGHMGDREIVISRGYEESGSLSPVAIAKGYIRNYLETAVQYLPDQSIDTVVVGVPQIWYDNPKTISGIDCLSAILEEIKEELAFKKIRVESEPTLACAHFAHEYKRRVNQDFCGKVILIDYGGGTLDINICEARLHGRLCEIKLLAQAGRGFSASDQVGQAGLAFMERVVRIAKEETSYTEANVRYCTHRLESYLMNNSQEIERRFARSGGRKLSSLKDELVVLNDGTWITYGMLAQSYEEIIEPVLKEALEEIDAKAKGIGVDIHDVKSGVNFQIGIVGGFANFCLVRKQIEKYLGGVGEADDPRYRGFKKMDLTGRERAIAYGAALVANEEVRICPTFPYSFGIAREGGDQRHMAFEFGNELEHNKPNYINYKGSNVPIRFDIHKIPRLYFDSTGAGNAICQAPVESCREVFDNIGGECNIGFSLDEKECLTLWIKRANGNVEKRKLPDIWNLFGKRTGGQ
ncbi:MAG: hypothetical protein LBT59_16300 [Clostridiales bacterium]|jgi:molecular chaperone DnaK|nr:hypothetical protein [Clostridiales bacterium]